MIAKFNPTGTHIQKGFLKVRVDLYPDIGDKTYKICHIQVPVIPPEGYQGKVGRFGVPLDQQDYNNWIDSLPKVWQLNSALGHFIKIKETSTKADLTDYLNRIYTPTLIKTLDDSLILSKSAHLISPLMRDKSALTTEKIITKDIEDLVEIVNSRFASLVLEKRISDEGLSITPQTIDVGATADNERGGWRGDSVTWLSNDNLANASGSIDTVEFWFDVAKGTVHGVQVATFYLVSGTTYKSRAKEVIGDVPNGSKWPATGLDMSVVTDDLIGIYFTDGGIEVDYSGFGGMFMGIGEHIDPDDETSYSLLSGDAMSVYGTGTEAAPAGHPYSSRVQGVQGMRSWGGI